MPLPALYRWFVASRSGLLGSLIDLLRPSRSRSGRAAPPPDDGEDTPGRSGSARTIEVRPPGADQVRISYAPRTDGDPDAGEVVWTWVPYE
jgi:hypothetical protein